MVNFLLLDKTVSNKFNLLISFLKEKDNIVMVPYSGYRSLEEQSDLYCKGRDSLGIEQTIKLFNNKKLDIYTFIAHLLENSLRKRDRSAFRMEKIVTRAMPGFSFHNWGLALDCYYQNPETKKAEWDLERETEEGKKVSHYYKTYADRSKAFGITPGFYFKKFIDPVHIQYGESILDVFKDMDEGRFPDSKYYKEAHRDDLFKISCYG